MPLITGGHLPIRPKTPDIKHEETFGFYAAYLGIMVSLGAVVLGGPIVGYKTYINNTTDKVKDKIVASLEDSRLHAKPGISIGDGAFDVSVDGHIGLENNHLTTIVDQAVIKNLGKCSLLVKTAENATNDSLAILQKEGGVYDLADANRSHTLNGKVLSRQPGQPLPAPDDIVTPTWESLVGAANNCDTPGQLVDISSR
jgi:hypothetical protein